MGLFIFNIFPEVFMDKIPFAVSLPWNVATRWCWMYGVHLWNFCVGTLSICIYHCNLQARYRQMNCCDFNELIGYRHSSRTITPIEYRTWKWNYFIKETANGILSAILTGNNTEWNYVFMYKMWCKVSPQLVRCSCILRKIWNICL